MCTSPDVCYYAFARACGAEQLIVTRAGFAAYETSYRPCGLNYR